MQINRRKISTVWILVIQIALITVHKYAVKRDPFFMWVVRKI